LRSTSRELWPWTQIGLRAQTHGPNGGVADSLDDAKAAFQAAWERPLSERKATFGLSISAHDPLRRIFGLR
jgi:hypothetical protein